MCENKTINKIIEMFFNTLKTIMNKKKNQNKVKIKINTDIYIIIFAS